MLKYFQILECTNRQTSQNRIVVFCVLIFTAENGRSGGVVAYYPARRPAASRGAACCAAQMAPAFAQPSTNAATWPTGVAYLSPGLATSFSFLS